MRRSYRTGAAAAATVTLLTGAGIALASLEAGPPVQVAAASSVSIPAEAAREDVVSLEDLDAELADLRGEAKDLKARIAARTKAVAEARAARKAEEARAARAAEAAEERAASDDDTGSGTTGAGSQSATRAPDVDATTGASGSGEEHESGDDDDKGSERGGDDD